MYMRGAYGGEREREGGGRELFGDMITARQADSAWLGWLPFAVALEWQSLVGWFPPQSPQLWRYLHRSWKRQVPLVLNSVQTS